MPADPAPEPARARMTPERRAQVERIAACSFSVHQDQTTCLGCAFDDTLAELRAVEAERDEARGALAARLREDHRDDRANQVTLEIMRERDEARETNRRLNRRASEAEAALRVKIEEIRRQGPSLGRMLAGAAASMYRRDLDEAVAALEPLARAAPNISTLPDHAEHWETNLMITVGEIRRAAAVLARVRERVKER